MLRAKFSHSSSLVSSNQTQHKWNKCLSLSLLLQKASFTLDASRIASLNTANERWVTGAKKARNQANQDLDNKSSHLELTANNWSLLATWIRTKANYVFHRVTSAHAFPQWQMQWTVNRTTPHVYVHSEYPLTWISYVSQSPVRCAHKNLRKKLVWQQPTLIGIVLKNWNLCTARQEATMLRDTTEADNFTPTYGGDRCVPRIQNLIKRSAVRSGRQAC